MPIQPIGRLLPFDASGHLTRDLWPCYQVFIEYRPDRAEEMRQALLLAIDPTDGPAVLKDFLETFGRWLAKAAVQQLGTASPGENAT